MTYQPDQKEIQLLTLLSQEGGGMHADDLRLDEFADDRPFGNDTINRLIDAGIVRQRAGMMEDDYTLRLSGKLPDWNPAALPAWKIT